MTYYIGKISRTQPGEVEEFVPATGTLTKVVSQAVEEFGVLADWTIYKGDATGPDYEVLYHAEEFPDTLFTVGPDLVPGQQFMTLISLRGDGGRRFTVAMAPEVLERSDPPSTITAFRRYPYPSALRELAHFEDTSYGNDVTDSVSFAIGDTPYVVWVAAPSVFDRAPEVRDVGGSRFALSRLRHKRGDSIKDSIDEHQDDGDVELETESANALIAHIAKLQATATHDPTAERFRMLELDKGALARAVDLDDDDSRQRFRLLELNGRHRGNPSRSEAREAAIVKYEEFHRFKPAKLTELSKGFKIPKQMLCAGDAKWTIYRSSKVDPSTLVRPRKPVSYIHEHDAGVRVYFPVSADSRKVIADAGCRASMVDVPREHWDVESLVKLGASLGFAFEDAEVEYHAPYPELWCSTSGKCLYVVDDRRELLAMIWGGALGVFARGIDG